MIADYAEIVGGKLYLMGGGWDTYGLGDVPGQIRFAIALGVRIAWDETNQPQHVVVTIEDDDGQVAVRIEGDLNVGRPPDLPPGASQLAQMAANVPLTVQKFGGYRARIQAGGDELSLPFRVIKR